MDNGEIVESGPPDELFLNPKFERTKAFLNRSFKIIYCFSTIPVDFSLLESFF